MKLTFLPEENTVEYTSEQTVLEVCQQAGVELIATCGGKGRCNHCRIQILEGKFPPPTAQEVKMLGEKQLSHGFRLGCQTRALSDAVVRIAPPISEDSLRILSQSELPEYEIDPDVHKHHLILPHLSEELCSSDVEELHKLLVSSSACALEDDSIQHIDLSVLQRLPAVISQNLRDVTAVTWNQQLIALEPEDTTQHIYGVAVDLGTTTVVGYLLDLRTGNTIAVASELNAQALYGGDVMSRITFALQSDSGQHKLHQRVIKSLTGIIDNLCEQSGVNSQHIYEVVIVGNTCMHHLALNIPPVHLGVAPYLATFRQRYAISASQFGLPVYSQARVVMLPLIAGFVGADTVAVVLATRMHTRPEITLAIDIGTNGEVVLGNKDRLLACSAAAGTAFEGAQITHGMRGAAGAIDRVLITHEVQCHVIEEGLAQGICGSGLVDAVAQLLDAGIINANGRLLLPEQIEKSGRSLSRLLQERIIEQNGQRQFILMYEHQTKTGVPIVLTQQDIRELQLAKGAIAAGIAMLMKEFRIQPDDLSNVLLAGAFGNYIDTKSALRIGLIPAVTTSKIRSVGNAAGMGAQLALLNCQFKREADEISQKAEHLALTNNQEFQTVFAENMTFPVSDPSI